jgi:hypothetical protein
MKGHSTASRQAVVLGLDGALTIRNTTHEDRGLFLVEQPSQRLDMYMSQHAALLPHCEKLDT